MNSNKEKKKFLWNHQEGIFRCFSLWSSRFSCLMMMMRLMSGYVCMAAYGSYVDVVRSYYTDLKENYAATGKKKYSKRKLCGNGNLFKRWRLYILQANCGWRQYKASSESTTALREIWKNEIKFMKMVFGKIWCIQPFFIGIWNTRTLWIHDETIIILHPI